MRFLIAFFLLLVCVGCSEVAQELRGDPAPDSGFIEHTEDMAEWKERAPVHKIWFKDREKFYRERDKYKKICFKPVATDFIITKGWWDKLNTADREQYHKDLEEMAGYVRNAFEHAFRDDPNNRFEVVERPDAETIVYSLALTELIATKAHVNAAGTALGLFVPGGGLLKTAAKGSIAIEANVYDGGTNELLVTWADREQDRSALFSFSDFSWYSHARATVDNWASQLVEGYNTPIDHKVEDRTIFTLNPF
ncbi:MAG: DUF3313 family protein [Bdellovibrionales bacterium]|nr:DUF3313 family protein [Bdellovibrionales bacterium]